METYNTFDDVQESVVDSPEVEVTSEVTEESTESVKDPVEEVAKPQQTPEENAKFAEFRRKAEAAEREAYRIKAENERLLGALKGYGYDGSPEEIADLLMAQSTGITQEEAKAQREAEEQRLAQENMSKQELQLYKSMVIEQMKERDLNSIKAAYPDVKASKIEDLGETFIKIFNTGQLSATEAFEAARVLEQRNTKPTPPSMGAVNSKGSGDKDFYTPSEVDKLTEADYDRNPKLMEIVRKSMLKWK